MLAFGETLQYEVAGKNMKTIGIVAHSGRNDFPEFVPLVPFCVYSSIAA